MRPRCLSVHIALIVYFALWFPLYVAAKAPCAHLDTTGIPEKECNALVELYQNTQGEQWVNSSHWNTAQPVEQWFGVSIKGGRVIGISLPSNKLSGELPVSLGHLEKLEVINLSENLLKGTLPETLGSALPLREMYLAKNRISGTVPESFRHLKKLLILDVGYNHLSGSLPLVIGELSALRRLVLRYNRFTGEIPSNYGNLKDLRYFGLDNLSLEGQIPPSLGNLGELQHLLLFSNRLSGYLPPELGKLGKLLYFDIDINNIGGTIPPEFGNMHSLTRLDLDHNQLVGTVPPEIGNLVNLTDFYMRNNKLEGELPETLGKLVNVEKCFLEDNKFTGTLPKAIFGLPKLRWLRLENNRFSGEIPEIVGTATKLERLTFQANQLTGTIPDNITQLKNLQLFDLSHNSLHTNNPQTIEFLNRFMPNWASTQTLGVRDLRVQVDTTNTATVHWTPNPYQPASGFYRIWLGRHKDGDFINQGSTTSLADNTYTLPALKPDTHYYVYVSTYVPFTSKQSTPVQVNSTSVHFATSPDKTSTPPECFTISQVSYDKKPITLTTGEQTSFVIIDEPEGEQRLPLDIVISRPSTKSGKVGISYDVRDGTATNYMDYRLVETKGRLVFAETELNKTLSIEIRGDYEVEKAPENFRVSFSNPDAGLGLCKDSLEIQINPSDYPPKMKADTWFLLHYNEVSGSFVNGGVAPLTISKVTNPEIIQLLPYQGGDFIEFQTILPGETRFTLSDSSTPANSLEYYVYVGIRAMLSLSDYRPTHPPFSRTYKADELKRVNAVYPLYVPESDNWLESQYLFFFVLMDGQLFQIKAEQHCPETNPTQCTTHYVFAPFDPANPFFAYRQPSWITDYSKELKNVNGLDLTQLDFSEQGLNIRNTDFIIFKGFAKEPNLFLQDSETLFKRLTWSWYVISIK
jgi:Leucine-rich repeat (LRR) protein